MKKEFDAVLYQRSARKKMSERYRSDPDGFLKELYEKYGHLRKKKALS